MVPTLEILQHLHSVLQCQLQLWTASARMRYEELGTCSTRYYHMLSYSQTLDLIPYKAPWSGCGTRLDKPLNWEIFCAKILDG